MTLTLYAARSPTVFKVLIALEELGLAAEEIHVDVSAGQHLTPNMRPLVPNGRIPVLVDHAPADGGEPFSVFESGAILIYLAEKEGRLLPTAPRARSEAIQWVMWQMANLGPAMGQARHFRHFALGDNAYAVARFTNEATRLFEVLDRRLAGREFVGGADYTIADICCWPWLLYAASNGQTMSDYPELERWFKAVEARPAVQRVAERWWKGQDIETAQAVPEDRRRILFGRTTDAIL